MKKFRAWVVCMYFVSPSLGLCESLTTPALVPPIFEAAPESTPARPFTGTEVATLVFLPSAESASFRELAAMEAWNLSGNKPLQIGFARDLPAPQEVAFSDVALRDKEKTNYAGGTLNISARDGTVSWGTLIKVDHSRRLRLHLAEIQLPKDTHFWVSNESQSEIVPFDLDLLYRGDLVTPSVAGPVIRLEIEIPLQSLRQHHYSFRLTRVFEEFDVDLSGRAIFCSSEKECKLQKVDLKCLRDAACVHPVPLDDGGVLWPNIESTKTAIGMYTYIDNNEVYQCTGGLLSDTNQATYIPYFLTANHCISTQAAAATVEAFFDYIALVCDGPAPDLGVLPRVNKGLLLATREETDFALLRLNRLPAGSGRKMLGIARPDVEGVLIHRLSHPAGLSLRFSTSATGNSSECPAFPRPDFFFSFVANNSIRYGGTTFGGSSGAPALDHFDNVVGQLWGRCKDVTGCTDEDSFVPVVDGSIDRSYPYMARFLNPTAVPRKPTHLKAVVKRDRAIFLEWRRQEEALSYIVEMKQGKADFQEIGRSGYASFLTKKLPRGTYLFRITAVNSIGLSFPSRSITVRVN